jgi:hypothetical protein
VASASGLTVKGEASASPACLSPVPLALFCVLWHNTSMPDLWSSFMLVSRFQAHSQTAVFPCPPNVLLVQFRGNGSSMQGSAREIKSILGLGWSLV